MQALHTASILALSLGSVAQPPADGARVATAAVTMRDGQWRADGPDWSATFDAGSAVFVPALGRVSPHRFPVRLRTVTIGRAGGESFPAETSDPDHVGDAIHYAPIEGTTERWRATPAGLELSYELREPLPGGGDLVVRLAVTSELAPAGAAADGSLRLSHARYGGIRIGAVTGIDALGVEVPGTARWNDETLELRLPSGFVDRARYPLLLDPLIGTERQVGNGDDSNPDVAFDAASQSYLVVFDRTNSLTSVDVLGQRYDVQGNPIGGLQPFYTSTNRIASHPTVCSVAGSGRFVIAWREAPGVLGPWAVRCSALDANLNVTTIRTLASSGAAIGPRLSGAATLDTRAIVVWASPSSLYTASLSVPASPAAAVIVGSDDVPTGLATTGLDVTRSGGSPDRRVALVDYTSLGAAVEAHTIDRDGQIVHTLVVAGSTVPTGGPVAIDGDGSGFAAIYRRNQGTLCQRLRWAGSALVLDGTAAALAGGGTEPRIAWLGPKYLVVWTTPGSTPGATSIGGIALQDGTCLPCSNPFTIDLPGYDFAPIVGSQRTAGTNDDQAMIAFVSADVTAPFASNVFVQLFDGQTPGAARNLGGECGGAFAEAVNGPVSLGNTDLQIRADGISGSMGAFLHVGPAGASPLPCGSCRITVPIVQMAATVRRTQATALFPIACEPSLVGGKLEVQFLILLTSSSACPLVSGLAFSDRLELEIGH